MQVPGYSSAASADSTRLDRGSVGLGGISSISNIGRWISPKSPPQTGGCSGSASPNFFSESIAPWSQPRETYYAPAAGLDTVNMLNIVHETRFSMDSRAILKAFRLIGGFDGIQIEDLRSAALKVRDENIRSAMLAGLDQLFKQFDSDKDQVLDIIEFERLVQSSTIIQQAVHELVETADIDEKGEDVSHDVEVFGQPLGLDVVSVGTSLIYVFIIALQTDIHPDWVGWHLIELVFLCLLSAEIVVRCSLRGRHGQGLYQVAGCIRDPMNFIDLVIATIGWIDIVVVLSAGFERKVETVPSTLRWVRLLRLARCARLIRVLWYCQALRVLIAGIWAGILSAVWGFVLISSIAFVWAVLIRTTVANKWTTDNSLRDTFSSMPESFLVIIRCMALNADGACNHDSHDGSIYGSLTDQFGIVFSFAWVLSEMFIVIALFNAVIGVFVVQATENSRKMQESINNASHREDQVRLEKLDRMLRTLIHPGREESNPKDRNAAEVAKLIRTEHPDSIAKMPNLETQLVHFARSIHDAKKLHQNAMDIYEANEVLECKKLRNIAAAKTYVLNGEECLRVEDSASIANELQLPCAPVGAVEMVLLQERETLEELINDSAKVQEFVKSVLLPSTPWAQTVAAGSSGDVWKLSKGLCDEVIDPGPKSVERIEMKVNAKYHGKYSRNRDYCRLALVYDSVNHLIEAVPKFLKYRLATDHMQIVSLENRFINPHPLGWRDVTMLLKVKVPSAQNVHHIMELQMRLKELMQVSHEAHKFYEEIRTSLPDTLVTMVLDRLVTDTTLDLGITKMEWLQCLPNKEVKKLLDGLGIPVRCRRQLFDLVDIDGSGTVTSAELQETLRLFKTPTQAHELAGCHFRVRDVQQMLRTKLEPQLLRNHNQMVKRLSANETLLKESFRKLQSSINKMQRIGTPVHQKKSKVDMPAPRKVSRISEEMSDLSSLASADEESRTGFSLILPPHRTEANYLHL